MSTDVVTPSYRPLTSPKNHDSRVVLSLVLSILASESSESKLSQNTAVASSSYIKASTRSSQEQLIQAKAEVDIARVDLEARDKNGGRLSRTDMQCSGLQGPELCYDGGEPDRFTVSVSKM